MLQLLTKSLPHPTHNFEFILDLRFDCIKSPPPQSLPELDLFMERLGILYER